MAAPRTGAAEAAAETEAAKDASAPSGAGTTTGSGPPTGLFALPLYRKPAFPGFYQIVQVSEQEVFDFLITLRKGGQGEYLGGFMTKELPSKLSESEGMPPVPTRPPSGGAGSAAVPTQAQGLRRDAGRVGTSNELEDVGTVLKVFNLTQYPNFSGGQVVVMPRNRVKRTRTVSQPTINVPLAAVAVEHLTEPKVPENDEEVKALHQEIVTCMKELLKTSFLYKEQYNQVIKFYDLDNPLKLSDLIAGMSLADRKDLQAVLAEPDLLERQKKVLVIIKKDLEFARLQSEVRTEVEEKVNKEQRRVLLMEQMKQITKELGIEKDEKQTLVIKFREAIQGKAVPEEVEKVIETELAKLATIEPSSSEFNVCRNYLEWLTCLPWGHVDVENKDIQRAQAVLDEDHFGLEDVKERILEHIAVSFLKESVQGKIMCLVGPPGVGKTSIGKSIARALDRKFYRFSVGGMHDVAELRGHRRTYVGAMPGKLIQCLKLTQSSNPVVLIDEIDKLGRDMRGDPSSALLEILDPEQNGSFRDHYLDVPVDLSQVLFVCTANEISTIPGPLLDRMEVMRIAGYVFEEKVAIAEQYLIPQTEEQSGIGADSMELQNEALHKMISDYAREAGVRHLKQLLEKVTRKVALSKVRKPADSDQGKITISPDNLTQYIGQPLHLSDRLFESGKTPPGVVMGLAWTSLGGATLYVEARGRLPMGRERPSSGQTAPAKQGGSWGQGSMKITGQLGEVMTESSSISLTYAKLFVNELDSENDFLEEARIHLHVPEGATPKDGPSAGVTMATALVSLALDKPLKADVAMTGELTLTGKVLKVGGIKEKVIAARREGVKELILPKRNEADYTELKEYLRAGLTAHFVDHYDDVYRFAFEEDQVLPLPGPPRGLPVITVTTPEMVEVALDKGPKPLTDSPGGEQAPQPTAVPPPQGNPTTGPSPSISGKPAKGDS